ncbi:hypothetical protein [Streptomyces sp. NRRL S-1022]|uniref:hypothetical protein n=1 Tax=Streptomyces sp. NRRL S-1022 TaxID=1463880 RepID=UPI0004BE4F8E|nr:hypothetical protein [Streptomyces sp. NRRL S-1022]
MTSGDTPPCTTAADGTGVTDSGDATAHHGSVANTGIMGDVKLEHHEHHHHYPQAAPVPASPTAYLAQVRRIAPAELVGRDGELAEMAAFSTAVDSPGYLWWRAPAWAGKSALLSWFVLHPPVGVRVVSFFVTARFAGQSDRVAFTEALAEQLAGLIGERPPPLTAGNRDYVVLTLLDRAAAACSDCDERLVLVVDGIDEDRGVTAGLDAYSIASVLPAQPPAGLRVILAGRLHPPVPGDVPPDHPLHDPGIVRRLRPSERAKVVRRDMLRELGELLGGGPVERDLLGFITAAGGGLTARDLGELIGRPAWEVSERLGVVAGRSFGMRRSVWRPVEAPDVYVLGHEELQAISTERIGEPKLDAYRLRLHAWADGYRAREWPAQTPEYLLRGYFRLAHAADDLECMFACAVDASRHDRMLDLSGSDAAALEEINVTLHAFATGRRLDLVALGRLSVARAALSDRNEYLPEALPGLWCALGQVTRAEAMARAMRQLRQAVALADIARHIAGTGDTHRATVLARQAEVLARFRAGGDRWPALAAVARAYAAVGDTRRALTVAEEAETAAHGIEWALVKIAGLMTYIGATERAEAITTAMADPAAQTVALVERALSLVETGGIRQARGVVERCVDLVAGLDDVVTRARCLVDVARVLAATRDPASAVELAEKAAALAVFLRPYPRVWVWAGAARVRAGAGDATRAMELVGRAEESALEVDDPMNRATALTCAAHALADAGFFDRASATAERAEVNARSASLSRQVENLADLAIGLVAAGATDRAHVVACKAESLFQTPGGWIPTSVTMGCVAEALAKAGDIERADALVASPRSRTPDADTLARIATALATTGRPEEARAYAARAYAVAHTLSNSNLRAWMLREVACAFAAAGDIEPAEEIARGLPSVLRADVLTNVARALSAAGHTEQARASVEVAAAIMRSAADRHTYDHVRTDIAVVMGRVGRIDQAEELGNSLVDLTSRGRALAGVAAALARSGMAKRAGALADAVDALARSMSETDRPHQLLCDLATSVQPEKARQRLARALLSGGWRSCLEALAHVEPASVHAIATEVLARLDRDSF